MNKKTAIILFNLGGPDKLTSVKPFLFNLFNDKAIIDLPNPFRFLLAKLISFKRANTAKEIYSHIGGKSPILEITNEQAENLEKELSFSGDFKVFVCMRYWHPMAKEVVAKVKDYNPDEIIMLPLYPQFSTATTESSFDDFISEIKKQKVDSKIKKICCYPTNIKFIQSHAQLIKKFINEVKYNNHKKYRLLFSAHGLPEKIINKGDPYVFQINSSCKAIIAQILSDEDFAKEKIDFAVCFQSKVGPLKWTTPSLDDEITRAGNDKVGIIIVPIAFTSDHSETLVELDIEYKETAEEYKLPFYYRVKALNSDGYFIESLVDICKNISLKDQDCSSDNGIRVCPKNFTKCISQPIS
jgi:ferrochelatase